MCLSDIECKKDKKIEISNTPMTDLIFFFALLQSWNFKIFLRCSIMMGYFEFENVLIVLPLPL